MDNSFLILPDRTASAVENMADDSLLLDHFPHPNSPRFRHYKWENPSITFGYSQQWSKVHELHNNNDAIRRPTGGGIVEHASDWTYSIIIPPQHPLCAIKATESYLKIHEVIVKALSAINCSSHVLECKKKSCGESTPTPAPTSCFSEPVTYDVMSEQSSEKIAGAAQKRNKNGLLIQGTIQLPSVECESDFKTAFIEELSSLLNATAESCPWPEFDAEEKSSLIEKFSSENWNKRR